MTNAEQFEAAIGHKMDQLYVSELTWGLIEKIAMVDPVIHAGMHFHRYDGMSTEQTLIAMVLHASYAKAKLTDHLIRLVERQPYDVIRHSSGTVAPATSPGAPGA